MPTFPEAVLEPPEARPKFAEMEQVSVEPLLMQLEPASAGAARPTTTTTRATIDRIEGRILEGRLVAGQAC